MNERSKMIDDAARERDQMLLEAHRVKNQIIEEAKQMAQQEGAKIIDMARVEINSQKELAMKEVAGVSPNSICREIEFPPNLVNAGLSILNQFSAIINHKYPNEKIHIKIEQRQNTIRFYISSADGNMIEMIEEDLNAFGRIINGEQEIETLVNDPVEIMKIKHRLELTTLELKMVRELAQTTTQRQAAFDTERNQFYGLFEKALTHGSLHSDIIKDLIHQHPNDIESTVALNKIKSELAKEKVDETLIFNSLQTVHNNSPQKAKKVGEYIISFLSSTASATLVQVIKKVFIDGHL